MAPERHPDAATLVAYAAGGSSEVISLVVACHLAFCAVCRREVARAEAIGGLLLDDMAPDAVDGSMRAETLARLGEASPATAPDRAAAPVWMPLPLRRYWPGDLPRERWRWLAPGVRHLPLATQGPGSVRLVWAAPGKSLPLHGHAGDELTVVLAGSFSDQFGHFATGDVAELDETARHRPTAERDADCICLLASDGAAKPAGLLARVVARWLGV